VKEALSPVEVAPAPEPRVAELPPALALHRFAALVSGEAARIYPVRGRLLMRAGDRLFSLAHGDMHREEELELALAGPDGHLDVGSIGGRYPDELFADRRVAAKGADPFVRQYVRLAHGKAIEIGRARHEAHMAAISALSNEIADIGGGRMIARVQIELAEADVAGWLEMVPAPAGASEQAPYGFKNLALPSFALVARADGSVVVPWPQSANQTRLLSWSGAAQVAETPIVIPDERVLGMFESSSGVLFLHTSAGLYEQVSGTWRRDEDAVDDAWPMIDGAVLFSRDDRPWVRSATGAVAQASWPTATIEGRSLAVRIADARCTREAGFWAFAADGLGLFHDRPPPALIDVAKLPSRARARHRSLP
jgi:hypothetical protein